MTPRTTAVERKPIVIIGIGNPMRRDDGVGPAVICVLERELADACDLMELDGEPSRVIDAWNDRELAIIVDAVCTGDEPGTLHDLSADQIDHIDVQKSLTSSHYAGLAEAIELGSALGRLPQSLHVLGIEPGDLKYGLGLSPAVEATLDELVDRVRAAALN